jgi:electron transport complex protein RnfC
MGGAGFPVARKIRAAHGAHTLVINGVGCEPLVSIDEAVLLHDSLWVAAGAHACAGAAGAEKIILAVKADDAFLAELGKRYGEFDIVGLPDHYPAGAEKMILQRLSGSLLPPGARPFERGFLVQNTVTLRTIGRAIIDGVAVVERPLTLAHMPEGIHRNIVAPIGLPVRDVFETCGIPYCPETHCIIDSGLMMGRETSPDAFVEPTTIALMVMNRKDAVRRERSCTRCGACNTACPLGLHPWALANRIRRGKTASDAFRLQLAECFLCGLCSAACPADIPLVQDLERGKQWL